MPLFSDKSMTSITVKINQLSKPHRNSDLEDESIELYLQDLIDLIDLQPGNGPVEAARAVRKNIKYGETIEVQLQALNLLELLVLNSGPKIGSSIASDEKLADVLKGVLTGTGKTGTGSLYDRHVYQKVKNLAIGWKSELRDLKGYRHLASLWRYIPGSKGKSRGHSRQTSSAFDDEFAYDTPSSPKSPPRSPQPPRPPRELKKSPPPRPVLASPYNIGQESPRKDRTKNSKQKEKSKKKSRKRSKNGVVYADEQYKIPQINYDVEAPKIRNVLADCQSHTAALQNCLLQLRDGQDPLDDEKTCKEFNKCKKIRRAVLKYLQFVGAGDESGKSDKIRKLDEEFLGSLIFANELLVSVFKQYDRACGYTEEDPRPQEEESDSDESYYTSDLEEEEEEPEEEPEQEDSIELRLEAVDIQEGTSSKLQQALRQLPPLSEADSENPFGDSHALGR